MTGTWMTGTYDLPDSEGLGTVNETGIIIGDRIYSIQYYGSASSELFPIVEHMTDSFEIPNRSS
jgi:hypothetical protein